MVAKREQRANLMVVDLNGATLDMQQDIVCPLIERRKFSLAHYRVASGER